jgi:hypothetical protein
VALSRGTRHDRCRSTHIAIRLRERGHDVIAAVERGWEAEDDEALLDLCETDGRALVTNNVAEFMAIARRWAMQGHRHAGLVFTSDASMPRSRDTIGRYVEALDALLKAHPAGNSFADRVHWLTGGPAPPG